MTKVVLSALLIGVLFSFLSFSPVSMPMMRMGEMDSHTSHQPSENFSVMPCCEIIGNVCTSFVCNVTEFTKFFFIKETSRITSVTTATQLIFLDILSPPPKA